MLLLVVLLASPPIPAESRQLVLSVSHDWDDTSAEVRRYQRSIADRQWSQVGRPMAAALGRDGMAWGRGLHPGGMPGPVKHEGDGRSPTGVFELRAATGYAAAPPDGARLPYQRATEAMRCVDDPRSRFYNQLVLEGSVTKDWSSAEEMRREDELYRLVVWVGHNDLPAEPGAGSCIFLHIRSPAPSTTAGCTAFEAGDMEELVGWLDPAERPILVQLPSPVREDVRSAWGLP